MTDHNETTIEAVARRNWRRCPHASLRGIYGDEINAAGGRRLHCRDCGRLLDGPVSLALDAMGLPSREQIVAALRADAWEGHDSALSEDDLFAIADRILALFENGANHE